MGPPMPAWFKHAAIILGWRVWLVSPTLDVLVMSLVIDDAPLGNGLAVSQCQQDVADMQGKATESLGGKGQIIRNDIMAKFLECMDANHDEAVQCSQNITLDDLVVSWEKRIPHFMKCAPGNPLNMPMCSSQVAPDVARYKEDMAEFIVEAEVAICRAHYRPLCRWTYRFPLKNSTKRMVCIPKTCTEKQLEDAYAKTTYHLTDCQAEERNCTLTIECPSRNSQLLWFVVMLVVVGMGIVAFIMWRKHVNT